jgi:hypothetical protein
MIAPVFDEIPAYEQAFSPNLLFFQHPLPKTVLKYKFKIDVLGKI